MAKLNKIFTFSFLLWLFFSPAYADLTIQIDQSDENALPIAVVPFSWQGNTVAPPEDIASIVSADFLRTGKFKPIAPDLMPQLPTMMDQVDYAAWRPSDVDNILIGQVTQDKTTGLFTINAYFMDVLRKQKVFAKRWADIPKKWLRAVAHQISDLMYQDLTGIRGDFNTKIAYVTMTEWHGKRQYALEVSDADGHNSQKILKSSAPIMSPSWSPDGTQLAYVSFENGRSEIFTQSLNSTKRHKIASFKGINGAPAWSPDGKSMAMALSKNGSADIYMMNLKTRKLKRLTTNWAIETEPVWASNGRSLYFNSDRRGKPQIFQVFLDTGEERRVSFNGTYNANPEISPDGRYLVMVHGDHEHHGFHIGVLDLFNNQFNVITKTFLDESPSFSPNGQMILYAMNKNGKGHLASVSVDGSITQVISVKSGQVRDPAWGPFQK